MACMATTMNLFPLLTSVNLLKAILATLTVATRCNCGNFLSLVS